MNLWVYRPRLREGRGRTARDNRALNIDRRTLSQAIEKNKILFVRLIESDPNDIVMLPAVVSYLARAA